MKSKPTENTWGYMESTPPPIMGNDYPHLSASLLLNNFNAH